MHDRVYVDVDEQPELTAADEQFLAQLYGMAQDEGPVFDETDFGIRAAEEEFFDEFGLDIDDYLYAQQYEDGSMLLRDYATGGQITFPRESAWSLYCYLDILLFEEAE